MSGGGLLVDWIWFRLCVCVLHVSVLFFPIRYMVYNRLQLLIDLINCRRHLIELLENE